MINSNFSLKKCTGYILFLASVMMLILMSAQTVTDDIWYDEVFSLSIAREGIGELIRLTSRDVHPPFYYIYLKVMISILQIVPGIKYVTAAKLASVIPAIALLTLAVTHIRKTYGELVMGLFSLLIISMPEIGNYYVEIRMYSLALLMITGAGLIALSIIREGDSVIKWFVFWITGILTAYTQYYACIGTVGVYIALFIMILLGKDRAQINRRIKYLSICATMSVVLYIPWIPTLIRQSSAINGNYWIQPLTIRSIAGCVKFIVLPVAPYGNICIGAAVLLILTMGILCIINLVCCRNKELLLIFLIGITPLAVIIISGFVLSALGTPVFVYRYMIPALGLMWFSIALLIDRAVETKKICIFLIIPFIISGLLTVRGFYLEEHKKVLFMEDTVYALNKLEPDAAIVCNFDHVASIMGYRLENDIFLYEGEIDRLIPDMLHGTGTYINDEGVKKLLNDGRKVYFLGSFNSREEILDNWSSQGIVGEEQDSVLLERYWFNIYRLWCE